jgi:hypothetical protein
MHEETKSSKAKQSKEKGTQRYEKNGKNEEKMKY